MSFHIITPQWTKPLQFSDKLHIEDLSVSVGWLAKFKERFHIKQYHKAEKAIEWIYRLLELVAKELATLLCIFFAFFAHKLISKTVNSDYNHITNKIPESLVKEIILKLNPHTIAAKFLYSPGWIRPAPPKSGKLDIIYYLAKIMTEKNNGFNW
ncbi:11888_t:CDS:2 [Entrophospora sp. SA101]|nr:11888_t:CDS:2 [Entrophospora sp. SA101]